MCPRSSASSSRPSSLTTAPSTIARPASGSSSPTMHLRVTLLPEPEYPMMTVFCPSGTSSVTPSRTRRSPKDFVNPSSWIMRPKAERRNGGTAEAHGIPPDPRVRLSACRPSQQHQRPERVQHQDRFAAQHDGPGGGQAHALRAALRIEAARAAHEGDGGAEAGAFHQAEPDVLELVEQLEALEELGGREIQQVDRGDPPRGDADRH